MIIKDKVPDKTRILFFYYIKTGIYYKKFCCARLRFQMPQILFRNDVSGNLKNSPGTFAGAFNQIKLSVKFILQVRVGFQGPPGFWEVYLCYKVEMKTAVKKFDHFQETAEILKCCMGGDQQPVLTLQKHIFEEK